MADTTSIPHVTSVELRRAEVPDFGRFPFTIPAIASLEVLTLHPSVTFLVGDNGSGKSTLLEGIAVALGMNAEGGGRNFNFSTRASHSGLADYLRVRRIHRRGAKGGPDTWFLRAESYFNVATEIEELDKSGGGPPLIDSYGGRSLHEQSHGESFLALFMHRFSSGLYLLDEPEAALSPARQLVFLSRLHDLVTQGAQLIIATHSPIIMAYPNALIYSLGSGPIAATKYADTEHYRITRDFLTNPDRSLDVLLDRSAVFPPPLGPK